MICSNRAKSFKLRYRHQTKSKVIHEYLAEFCSNSSIHGVRYLAEQKRHWTETCWWLIAVAVSICLCGFSIHNIWMKWHDNPVTISFTEKKVPISAIPFPTVTICPATKMYKHKLDLNSIYFDVDRTTENRSIDDVSSVEFSRISALVHVCQMILDNLYVYRDKYANESIYDVIRDVAPTLQETVFACKWQYDTDHCGEFFVPILTDVGLCFAYNALNSRDMYTEVMAPEMMTINTIPSISNWSIEQGYKDGSNKKSYPKRIFNSAQDAGLIFFLQLYEKDLEYLCQGTFQGFKIYLHAPGETLKMSKHSFRVPILEEAEISIKPTLLITDENLRYYKPNQRKCFFDSERHLRFFKTYGQRTCDVECLTNFTLRECGCVKFSMPRNATTKICGAASVHCYRLAERKLFKDDAIDGLIENSAQSFREKCNCLPSCTSITYSAEIDRAKYNWLPMLKKNNLSSADFSDMRPSTVNIFFREQQVTLLKRVEVYTYTDFLAVCGGLLGLFLGVSVLSIVEFLYYSTLRLYWTVREWKSQRTIVPLKRKSSEKFSIELPNACGDYGKNKTSQFKRPYILNWQQF